MIELIVLDSAGRLQVPKDYLDQFNINRRVQLELLENGILIKPVAERHKKEEASVEELVLNPKKKGLQRLLSRFRRSPLIFTVRCAALTRHRICFTCSAAR